VNGYGKKRTTVNGTTYEGQWQNGLEHGKGTEIEDNGSMYEGDWREAKNHGSGKYYFADGGIYEGDWREGKIHGNGTAYTCIMLIEGCTRDNGLMTRYMGMALSIILMEGCVRDNGQWANGKMQGNGTYYNPDGGIYQVERKVQAWHMHYDMYVDRMVILELNGSGRSWEMCITDHG
jgi:hypothetical protein